MYLGRSPCCLMSSPLVPPSGYFQLCTQDNDVFWAHPCSQGDNACDFNDYVAFPLGSTSSSKCFLLNLPPTQIVGCNEHCCVWDLSRKFCIIICLVCVIFLLLHDYSSSRSVWGKCGGRWKAHVPMQLSPTPLSLLIWQPLCHRQCLQAVQECCRLVSVKIFQSSVLSSAFFFFSLNNPEKLDWLKWHVLSREDTNNFDFCLFADCKPLSDGRDEYGLSLRLLRYNFGRVNSSEHQKS